MAKLTKELKEKILTDYKLGKSQNFLARKYELSPATINKLCKNVQQTYKDKVNTVVSIKSDLSQESEYFSECFDKEVNKQLMNKNLVFTASQKALKKINELLELVEDPKALKDLVDAIDKSSLTLNVNPRFSNSSI